MTLINTTHKKYDQISQYKTETIRDSHKFSSFISCLIHVQLRFSRTTPYWGLRSEILPDDTTYHPRRLGSLSTVLLDPQILHYLIFHTDSAYSVSSRFKKYVILIKIFLGNEMHKI